MKSTETGVLLSASDLMRFMGCQHATALDLAYLQGAPLTPGAGTEDAYKLSD